MHFSDYCIAMSITKNIVFQFANIITFIATVIVNALANTSVLNGKTTGAISDQYPTLITPAGYVFSIWGVIYTLLFVFIVFQVLPKQKEAEFLQEISFLFALSNVLNILWLFLWQYEQIALSVVPMFALLASLIAIYLRLDIGRAKVYLKERLCVHLPFSVYLGWITVASITNVAVALTAINWDGFGLDNVTWAVLVIVVALMINLLVIIKRRDIAYSLVIIWALVGIIVKQIENQSIVITAAASAIIIVLALILVNMVKRV
jgi:benzodiazapine receptor